MCQKKPISIKQFIEGRNPLQNVVKVEVDSRKPVASVMISSNGKKEIANLPYTKFIFMRDIDLLSDYFQSEKRKIVLEKKRAVELQNEADQMLSRMEAIKEENKLLRKNKKTNENKIDNNSQELEILKRKYDTLVGDVKAIHNRAESINSASSKIGFLPSMKSLKDRIEEYNRKRRLYNEENKVIIEALTPQTTHKRLQYGYTYIIKTNGIVQDIYDALAYAGLPFKGENSDIAKSMEIYLAPKEFEMFYISTGIRPFKGINDYSQLHRLYIDIETTSLSAQTAECKKCSKKTPMSNEHDAPKRCTNTVVREDGTAGYCNSTDFTIPDTGRITVISMKDSNGYKKAFMADDEAQEKEILEVFFKTIHTLKPDVVSTYNGENFDWGYILIRAKRLGINMTPNKCLHCHTGFMVYDASMKEYRCNSCDVYITQHQAERYIQNPDDFAKEFKHKCPSCKSGNIVRGKKLYGCNNLDSCEQRYEVATYEQNVRDYMTSLGSFVPSTLNIEKAVYKTAYKSSLKVGSETEEYNPTVMWGVNIIDAYQSVKRTKAINSSLPQNLSLKIISKFKPLKGRSDRTYIQHKDINQMYYENKMFLVAPDNTFKPIPEGFSPKQYLDIANTSPESLEDYNGKFYGHTKTEIIEVEEINKEEVDEGSRYFEPLDNNDSELYGYISCKKFYDLNKGKFVLKSGKTLVEQYALDDVIDTENVDKVYTKERFLTVKYFPTNLDRFATMGVASAWNILVMAYCYENGLAIPHKEVSKLEVGGLSRMWVRGVEDIIQKMDFASLYPSLMLAFDMVPEFAPYIKDFLQYFYEMRMFYNTRKKIGDIELFPDKVKALLKFLKEDNNMEDYEKCLNWFENKEFEPLKAYIKDYVQNADNIQLPCKININALFGFVSSYVGLASDVMKGGQITSSGRMFLRGVIAFMSKFKCKPLICDTDGVNFSMPEFLEYDLETMKKLEEPIFLAEARFNGKAGAGALIAKYNSILLPSVGPMKLDADGTNKRSFNAAKKNYINVDDDGKVKFTGNSFKSSNTIELVKQFFNICAKKAIETGDLYGFVQDYYKFAELIIDGKAPMWLIAKKAKVKSGVDEYISRGVDKNGREKSKQAHMELAIANDLKPSLGSYIYYINNGEKASHKDADIFEDYLIEKKTKKVCSKCSKEKEGDICSTSTKKDGACNGTEEKILTAVKCINMKCRKEHYVDLSASRIENGYVVIDGFVCNKKTNGIACTCDEFEVVEVINKTGNTRPVSYLVSEKDIETQGMKIMPYNRAIYLEIFNNKIEPFKYMFPEEHRDFFMGMDRVRKHIPKDIKFNSEPFDRIEETFEMEKKEHSFWLKSGLNPYECVPLAEYAKMIKIPDFLPEWDEFNSVWFDISEKRPNKVIKPSFRMAKDGELFLEKMGDEYFALYERKGEAKNRVAIYVKAEKKWIAEKDFTAQKSVA